MPTTDREPTSRYNVLIVDDEPAIRDSLEMLTAAEYQVHAACSVRGALDAMSDFMPDVILLDLCMLGTSGIDGLRQIRQFDADVSVVIVSGYGSGEMIQEAMRCGATGYIGKPFDLTEFRETIEANVEQTQRLRRRHAASEPPADLHQAPRPVAGAGDVALLPELGRELCHDLANNLTTVKVPMQLIAEFMEKQGGGEGVDGLRRLLNSGLKQLDCCLEIIEKFDEKTSVIGESRRTCVVLDELLNDILEVSRLKVTESRVSIELTSHLQQCTIEGDRIQLFRALNNIVVNALEAMHETGGNLEIGCAAKGELIEVTIADDGPGMPPERLARIFQSQYTSKARSAGLGLSIAKRVIDHHEGDIKVRSVAGKGTTFTVQFPATPAGKPGAMEPAASDCSQVAVLYVAAEEKALKEFKEMLGDEFRVLAAASGRDGLQLLQDNGDIGVVIADQQLPEKGGIELLEQCRLRRPNAVRILATAHSDIEIIVESVNARRVCHCVAKPWNLPQLKGTLTQARQHFVDIAESDDVARRSAQFYHDLLIASMHRALQSITMTMNHQINNSLVPIKLFFDLLPGKLKEEGIDIDALADHAFWQDLYKNAQNEMLSIADNLRDLRNSIQLPKS
ncbi:MAG: response regulator [Lentisphaeria bacterium]|jgi:signal transduction histidine kinase|nr:response regulator [Lentisphaeria bacterium]MDP7742129.1 response regulator [Lentisphaeria bacterium]